MNEWSKGMIKNISNNLLSVDISSRGAELQSIKTVKDGLEYLWDGNPDYWIRRSPLLFPIVGMFQDNTYIHEGKTYEIELHGFTKVSDFEIVSSSDNYIEFKLVSNEETRRKYPFDFELINAYRLENNTLEIVHSVMNKGEKDMWFSIGEHPGFMCPLFEGESMEDYVLEFEKNETINRGFLEDGLLIDREELFLQNENIVSLSHKFFERRAIILKGLTSSSVTLKSCKHNRKVTVSFEGYPYLGIWSLEEGAPFVCIEPWYGVTSKKNSSKELKDKEGIICLEPGKLFKCGYSINVD